MSEYPKTCPHCKVDLTGEPIQEQYLQWYAGATHSSRVISIYDRAKDRTVKWKCPDCGHEWER